MESVPGTLYLVPVPLGPGEPAAVLPQSVLGIVRGLRYFVAENPRSARRFLAAAGYPRPLTEARIATLDEHTAEGALPRLLDPLRAGESGGLMSEAGCPAVADPGSALVRLAHAAGIRVAPLVGPCSILLALMGSGMNGQRFTFHGYLPAASGQRAQAVRRIEAQAARDGATHVFIETPYRSRALLETLLEALRADTWLGIALDLTLPTEALATRRVGQWRLAPPHVDRRRAVFLVWRG